MAAPGQKNLRSANITSAATTVVLAGPGYLEALIINKAGTTANTAVIYDGIDNTGVKIATIDGDAVAGSRFVYQRAINTGICVVTATGTQADITVTYAAQ